MQLAVSFVRLIFISLSILFMTTYVVAMTPALPTVWTYAGGGLLGLAAGGALIGCDRLFKRFNLRIFNTVIIGLFIGYLMALALLLIFKAISEIMPLHSSYLDCIKIFIFLFGTYAGVVMTVKSAEEIHVSIPFVKFQSSTPSSHDLLADVSALSDFRIAELASSGLLDRRLVVPRFLLSDLPPSEEGKRVFDVIKKLEGIPHLHLRFQETDFSETKGSEEKLLRLARLLDADILSADNSRDAPGIRTISLQALSTALKPLKQKGQNLKVKILRHGKDDFQGVGYLQDGTMVVVNGGADYIMQTVEAQVISVKQTPTGRIIFCNVTDGPNGASPGNWH